MFIVGRSSSEPVRNWMLRSRAPCPRLADLARSRGQVEIDDLAGAAPVHQLLRQHDAGIALPPPATSARKGRMNSGYREEIMVDLENVARVPVIRRIASSRGLGQDRAGPRTGRERYPTAR